VAARHIAPRAELAAPLSGSLTTRLRHRGSASAAPAVEPGSRLDPLGLQIELPSSVTPPSALSGIYSIEDPALKLDVTAAEKGQPTTIEEGKKWVRDSRPLDLGAEMLTDGWIVTYRNRTEFGDLYSLYMRRDIAGTGVFCRSNTMSAGLITAAIDACRSIKP
jgi:hypothetical protein